MHVLVDVGHPAHYHLFKHFARAAQGEGHRVTFTLREKDVARALLDHDGVPCVSTGPPSRGALGLAGEMLRRDAVLARLMRREGVDLAVGVANMMVAHAAALTGARCVILNDTEHVRLAQRLTLPFCDEFWTPDWYALDHGRKHVRYRGAHEAAYLHPRWFTADPSVARRAGVLPGRRNVVVRIVGWGAHHDVGVRGRLSRDQWTRIVASLAEEANVLVSVEGEVPEPLRPHAFRAHPAHMHHVLAACDLVVGEGATMASEAATLGVPAVYVNPLPAGNVRMQERFGLAWHAEAPARQEGEILQAARALLALSPSERARRRASLMDACDDLTQLLVDRLLP